MTEFIEKDFARQLEYLRDLGQEQAQVIKQLAGETLELKYIHPYDLYELLEKAVGEGKAISRTEGQTPFGSIIMTVDGVKYCRTPCIPAVTKNIF